MAIPSGRRPVSTLGGLRKQGGNNPNADTNPPEDQEDALERVEVAWRQAWFYRASSYGCINILLPPFRSEYHSGAIITPLMPLAPCTQFGHYAIQPGLDAGGIGEEHQARLRSWNVGSLLR
jgi:hypothetical protein